MSTESYDRGSKWNFSASTWRSPAQFGQVLLWVTSKANCSVASPKSVQCEDTREGNAVASSQVILWRR